MSQPLPQLLQQNPNPTRRQQNRKLWRKPWAVLTVPFIILFTFVAIVGLVSVLQFQVNVRPSIMMNPGGSAVVSCTVPRHELNRQITFGLIGPTESISTFTMDGENSRVTWDVTIHKLSCGGYTVFCEVRRTPDAVHPDGQRLFKQTNLQVCVGEP